ncbi:MAG: twin-arginine translocase TatA/TatE family subunit [Lentimicrobium sp.]|nr:twin-arginine translocase TatA/TatE family subunit [Lentimicrobium sp.]
MIILLGVLLIFGPKKMPEIARKIGRVMNELKKVSSDITKEFKEDTSVISREILSARESIQREAASLRKEIPDLATFSTEDTSIYPDTPKPETVTEIDTEELIENRPETD